jgi:hypothetical protein
MQKLRVDCNSQKIGCKNTTHNIHNNSTNGLLWKRQTPPNATPHPPPYSVGGDVVASGSGVKSGKKSNPGEKWMLWKRVESGTCKFLQLVIFCMQDFASGNFLQVEAKMKKFIAVNCRGQRVGEDHHNARLTDGEVELVRRLHDQGMAYSAIAAKFDVAKSTVQMICQYLRRAQTVDRHRVHVTRKNRGTVRA